MMHLAVQLWARRVAVTHVQQGVKQCTIRCAMRDPNERTVTAVQRVRSDTQNVLRLRMIAATSVGCQKSRVHTGVV